jgi:phosphotransferase system HPr (HPr) family protein
MVEQDLLIRNKLGLHARAAAKLVQVASEYSCDVMLKKDGEEIDAKSILGVLALGAAQGMTLGVVCDGEEEEQALAAVTELIENRFGEES